MKGKSKAFEELTHSHEGKPTRLQEKQCERCRYDVREVSLLEFIKTHSDKDTHKDKMTPTSLTVVHNFVELKVFRGSLDDCIGWSTKWS